MDAADYKIKEVDPFEDETHVIFGRREVSPYVNRLRLLWQSMRPHVITQFPDVPDAILNIQHYLAAERELMPAFFDLLIEEEHPAVRVVLGHFIFVYIHPYFDGNGRMGRFIMNLMMAAGGYSWKVVPIERRTEYMEALETASVEQDIVPFSKFLASLL